MNVFIKIQIKELADESRHIRKEEKRCKDTDTRNQMHHHRVHVVRPAARSALLAYGYCRGRPYRVIESNAKTKPDYKSIKRIVTRHGERSPEELENWLES